MAEARIDKWMWAVRIFKTRTIASEACKKGRISINGAQAKPARMVKPGDVVSVRKPPITYSFKVLQAIEKRVGAKLVPEMMENVTPKELPVFFKPQISKRIKGWDCSPTELIYGGVTKRNGSGAFLYWKSTELTTVQGYEGTVTLELAGIGGEVRLIDPIEGGIYAVGENVMKDMGNGLYLFENIPVKDYPLLLAFGDFCDIM